MGINSSKSRRNIFNDPLCQSHREALAAWHREGVAVTDVYDIREILGHGHMGEVFVVSRKKETRGSHINKLSRTISSSSSSSLSRTSMSGKNMGCKMNQRARSVIRRSKRMKIHLPKCKGGKEIESSPINPDVSDRKTVFTDSEQVNNGSVRQTHITSSQRRLYACKTVSTTRMKSGQMAEFLNEINIMRQLEHPYILELFEIYRDKRKIWLITELCTGGDLVSRDLGEAEIVVVLEQILLAVRYMHERGVCHRDIKLENILYENEASDADIKLIDFGLSQKFTRGTKMKKACGTVYTMAPELAIADSGGYSEKTDIWSIGVVAFVLLGREYPFLKDGEELKDADKKNRLLHARYIFGPSWKERGISQCGRDFIHGCLRKHPGMRWKAHEALEFVQKTWIPYLEQLGSDTEDSSSISYSSHSLESQKIESDNEAKESSSMSSSSRALQRSMSAKRRGTSLELETVKSMQHFCTLGLMKKTLLMTMAYTMDKSTLGKLRELFLSIDSEGTGTISLFELKKALKQVDTNKTEMTEDIITKVFNGVDHDHSGQIHYIEFLAAVAESQGLITLELLAETFDRLDSEGKGYISKNDLRIILGSDYNEDIVKEMINEADYKKNDQIDYEEFLRLMFEDPATGMELVGQHGDSWLADSIRTSDNY